ncbi:hypothetical protein ACGFNU_36985 [Spirillospora sp. NPDC048911]|uniref:hypothetical protein n=1 Tax=Spirillospora sp. NPDC048911 TaxID=3364527 RepID=UPI0037170F0F
MATSTRTKMVIAGTGVALTAGLSVAAVTQASSSPTQAASVSAAANPRTVQNNGTASIQSTKSDCPFSTKVFVYNGRLYAKTTVNCKKRHTISIHAVLHRKAIIGNSMLASGKKRLHNFKGKANVTASVPCNTVSTKKIFKAYGVLYDIRLAGYPIEVDDASSGYKNGC